MINYKELLGLVKHLTTEERLALIEATTQMLKEDLQAQKSEELPIISHSSRPVVLRSIEELQGSLNPQDRQYSEEELADLKYSYLAEKYGLKLVDE